MYDAMLRCCMLLATVAGVQAIVLFPSNSCQQHTTQHCIIHAATLLQETVAGDKVASCMGALTLTILALVAELDTVIGTFDMHMY